MTAWLIVGGVAIAALGLLVFGYMKLGRARAERDAANREAKAGRIANEIDEDVARVPESDLDDELRGS